ncbi:TetR/AcrR family transcriptional regulator [Leucobacter triazinivorans]|uniref:TetR/AcrR family transcriptional regulator n=1 Tax=Leucobacter triazinivorans TaxID=1784719 RepID=A0A4V0Z1Q0_9MICO|nr:TetR/AcrR family transcriptional regulator [Leucobacter triazinivorans]QBE49179.1 TetR/AcrR family transcriptional regulator [Leucobacter triazinivorans]
MNRVGEVRRKQQRGIRTRMALLEAAGRVFSRMEYDKAKLKDISDDAGISLGSLYFHFGNKDDVAAAVLDAQQERMTEVLSSVVETEGSSLGRLLDLLDGVAELISADALVQAGIRLVGSLPDELKDRGYGFYEEWQRVAETLIREGLEDGSVTSTAPAPELAEVVHETFIGAQVLSGMMDGWQTLPARIERARPRLEALLAPEA